MNFFKTEIQELLDHLMWRPEDWRISSTGNTLNHTKSKVQIWIYRDDFKLYEPVKADFRFMDRRRVRRIVNQWKENERRRRLQDMFNPNELSGGVQLHQRIL